MTIAPPASASYRDVMREHGVVVEEIHWDGCIHYLPASHEGESHSFSYAGAPWYIGSRDQWTIEFGNPATGLERACWDAGERWSPRMKLSRRSHLSLLNAMRERGLEPDEILFDGRMHCLGVASSSSYDDGPWYVAYPDGPSVEFSIGRERFYWAAGEGLGGTDSVTERQTGCRSTGHGYLEAGRAHRPPPSLP